MSSPTSTSGRFRVIIRRLLRNRGATAGALVVLIFLAVGLAAPYITPFDPIEQKLERALQLPSAIHLLGTDELGRDIFSRIVGGSRISLYIAAGSVFTALAVGSVLGILGGYFGGWLDAIISRIIDIMMALPSLLLAIAIIALFGVGVNNVILAVALGATPAFARLARASTLTVRNLEYIEAARSMGATDGRIIVRHILPNIMVPLIVQTSLTVASSLLTASGLSFLGLGAQPPTPEWGAMLATGRSYLTKAPHVAVFPGLAIMLVVLAFNLTGDGLRDALDPKMKR